MPSRLNVQFFLVPILLIFLMGAQQSRAEFTVTAGNVTWKLSGATDDINARKAPVTGSTTYTPSGNSLSMGDSPVNFSINSTDATCSIGGQVTPGKNNVVGGYTLNIDLDSFISAGASASFDGVTEHWAVAGPGTKFSQAGSIMTSVLFDATRTFNFSGSINATIQPTGYVTVYLISKAGGTVYQQMFTSSQNFTLFLKNLPADSYHLDVYVEGAAQAYSSAQNPNVTSSGGSIASISLTAW